jgi:hypothetical protein
MDSLNSARRELKGKLVKVRRVKSKALIHFCALLFILFFRLSAPAQETVDPKIIEGAAPLQGLQAGHRNSREL